jgi:hypothetical protein
MTARWPDEKAKLYFYPKSIKNPGLKFSKSKRIFTIADLIVNCDFFKQILPYDNPSTKMQILKLKRDKEKDEPRYCLRWACEKVYKDTENHDMACRCHPGKWDHGSTGESMKVYTDEIHSDPKSLQKKTVLWPPHWTCCHGAWESAGCRQMSHRGPLIEDLAKYNRKFKWPDNRVKLYFPREITKKWLTFVNRFEYDKSTVKKIFQKKGDVIFF